MSKSSPFRPHTRCKSVFAVSTAFAAALAMTAPAPAFAKTPMPGAQYTGQNAGHDAGRYGVHPSAPHGMAHATATHTQPVNVMVKRPQVLRLSRPAASVVVGDPSIADVAVHSTDTLLVLGRSYGTTNVIAMDTAGRIILDADINVGEYAARGGLRVYNGTDDRNSYRCAPDCLPAPSLGDSQAFIGMYRQTAPAINNSVATGSFGGSNTSGQNFGSQNFGADSFSGPGPSDGFADGSAPFEGFPGGDPSFGGESQPFPEND